MEIYFQGQKDIAFVQKAVDTVGVCANETHFYLATENSGSLLVEIMSFGTKSTKASLLQSSFFQ